MRLSIETRLALAFGAAFLLVFAAGVYAFHRTSQFAQRAEGIEAVHASLDELNGLLLLVHSAESGVRGYVLTGKPSELSDYREASNQIRRSLDSMRSLHGGDPFQLVRIATFDRLISSRLAGLERVVALRRDRGFAAARAELAPARADPREALLGTTVRRMQAEEVSRLLEVADRNRRDAQQAVWAVFLSGLMALTFLALAGLRARRDILLRGRAERERQRFFNLSTDALCLAGFDGRLKTVNPAWRDALGWSEGEVLGRPWTDFFHPQDRGAALAAEGEARRSGAGAFEGRFLCKGGGHKWLLWSLAASEEDGVFYAGARDLSLKHLAEEELTRARDAALDLARLKSDFVSNVSHEIRTPMSAIVGMTELMLVDPLSSAAQREHLGIIRDSTGALLGILNSVLDFSKLEAGRLELEQLPFDLRRMLEAAVQLFSHSAEAKGLSLRLDVDPGLPAAFVGDPNRLRQVVVNLIANAVKFTERGAVQVRAAKAAEAGGRVAVKIEVSDTGIGISEEGRRRLFQPFTQADGSTTRRFGGSGLGLAISRQLVELMGGSLEVRSEPGKGSTFHFSVSLRPAEQGTVAEPDPEKASEPASVSQPAVELPTGGSPLKILLVDDDPVIRKVAQMQLRALGYDSDVVTNGRQAVEASAREPYDLVLMDCQMPVLDGYAATAEIRAREKGRRRTPIIAMTARAAESDRRKCLDAGMDDHIAKPLTLEGLSTALARWDTPLDPFTLESLRKALGAPALAQVLVVFGADADERLAAMRLALERGDFQELAAQAHGLKGACGQTGARRMAAVCARLERAAKESAREDAARHVERLAAERGRVEEEIAKERALP